MILWNSGDTTKSFSNGGGGRVPEFPRVIYKGLNIYTDKDKGRKRNLERGRERRSEARQSLETSIYYRIKRSASKRGLEFNLDLEDIVLVDKCPYLGCELTYGVGHLYSPNQATVDRIDSSKGYVKGNIQIVSAKANTMKSNATQDELILFAKSVLRGCA